NALFFQQGQRAIDSGDRDAGTDLADATMQFHCIRMIRRFGQNLHDDLARSRQSKTMLLAKVGDVLAESHICSLRCIRTVKGFCGTQDRPTPYRTTFPVTARRTGTAKKERAPKTGP